MKKIALEGDLAEKRKKATAAQQKYDAKNSMRISLKLNKGTDADIIEEVNRASNKQGRIKELIRKGMKE